MAKEKNQTEVTQEQTETEQATQEQTEENEAAPATERRCVVKAPYGLNLRDAPKGNKLAVLEHGCELSAVGEPENGWVPVLVRGYVKAEHIAPSEV